MRPAGLSPLCVNTKPLRNTFIPSGRARHAVVGVERVLPVPDAEAHAAAVRPAAGIEYILE